MWPDPQSFTDLAIFTEEILNRKLFFVQYEQVNPFHKNKEWCFFNRIILYTNELKDIFLVKRDYAVPWTYFSDARVVTLNIYNIYVNFQIS